MPSTPNHQPQLAAAIKSLQLRAWSHSTTIRLASVTESRETAWKTGSGILLEFNGRAAIATAWHVLEEYQRLKSLGEEVFVICDNMPIVEPRTLYRSEAHDIAILELPAIGRFGLGAVPYRPGVMWPPPAVTVNDSVLVFGFPRLLRTDGVEILHGDLNLLVSVESVSDTYFMLQIELEQLVQAGRISIPGNVTDFGGVSGGAVFLYDGGCNPLVGLVSEVGVTLPLWRIASLAGVPSDMESRVSEAVWNLQ